MPNVHFSAALPPLASNLPLTWSGAMPATDKSPAFDRGAGSMPESCRLRQLDPLPRALRRIDLPTACGVQVAEPLHEVARQVDARKH